MVVPRRTLPQAALQSGALLRLGRLLDRHPPRFAVVLVALAASLPLPLAAQLGELGARPVIGYAERPSHDPVAELARAMADGRVQLSDDPVSGPLRSLLHALNVPVESQIALFAKGSLQSALISRQNPRTLFFNDTTAVGFVRGGVIELLAQDAEQGVHFYTLDPAPSAPRTIVRRTECFSCHYTYVTSNVPGAISRSAARYVIDHHVALEQRWGGIYVTADQLPARHLGNIDVLKLLSGPPTEVSEPLPSLEGQFDPAGYLARSSDVVALLVFDHQMRMMNLLTRLGWVARAATTDTAAHAAMTQTVDEVADYLLFEDEAPLGGAVKGSSGFAEGFAARGPRDHRGRSLRDFDLTDRIFQYRCSYMIYAPVFDALPADARAALYDRMWRVLSGRATSTRPPRASADERRAIVEILRDTKPNLPSYFDPARVL